LKILVQQVLGIQPPSFRVFCQPGDESATEPVSVPSPADTPVASRPNSNLLTELQWYLERFLDYPFYPELEHADRVQHALKVWGEAAFGTLFGEAPTGRLFDAPPNGDFAGLQLQIASDDPDVLGWPWEALRDPEAGILAHTCRMERRLGSIPPRQALPTSLPRDYVNILLIVARPFENDVRYRSIARPLVQLIERENLPARVEILRPPSLNQLRQHLAQRPGYYHLIHFDMHGAYRAGRTGRPEGSLVFEDDKGQPDRVSAAQLSALLREHAVPLVVLTACESARIDASSGDPFSSVATALLGAGIRNVVAMAYSLMVSGGEQFLPAFYRSLFQTGSVSEAVRAGRQQMLAVPARVCVRGTFPLQDWLLPVLYEQEPVDFSFATAARRPPRQSNLPAQLQPLNSPHEFIGRDAVLLSLERAMRRPEAAILIQAMAGTGKTTLAKGFLQWLNETDGLGSGAIWLSFQEVHSSEYVLNRLGEVLIGGDFAALQVEVKISVLTQTLKQIPLLMVWDNFESASVNLAPADRQHLAALLDQLNGGQTKVIITSRSTEGWLGRRLILQLTGLQTEERWELCNAILRVLGIEVDREDKQFLDLMELLDGHPLSMRLVLPKLARMTAAQVIEALQNNIADLELGESDAEDKLLATFFFIDEAVPEKLRPLLVPLAFFSRYAQFDLLGVLVKELGEPQTSEEINGLAALLVTSGVIRPFLNADGSIKETLFELHPLFTSYLRFRISSGKVLKSEVDRWAFPFVNQVARYADTLWAKPFHQQEGPFQILGLTFEYALDLALNLRMDGRYATALMQSLAAYAVNSRNFGEALELYRKLANFSESHNDQPSLATAYFELATLAQRAGQLDEAEDYHKKSLVIKEKLGDQKRLATSYYQLGTLMNAKRDYQEAMKYYDLALSAATGQEFHELRSNILTGMGQIAEEQYGDLDKANRLYLDALDVNQKNGLTHNLMNVFQHLASIARKQGRVQEAEGYLFNGRAVTKARRDPLGGAYIYRDLAQIRAGRGDLGRAREFYLQALEVFEQMDDTGLTSSVYHGLAELAVMSGDISLAEKWIEKIRTIDEGRELSAYFGLIEFVINADPILAERWARAALGIAERIGSAKSVSLAQQLLGVAAEVSGDFTTAISWYKAAIKTREGFGDELWVASGQAQLAGALFGQGKLFAGAQVLMEAIKIFQANGQVGLVNSARAQFQEVVQKAPPGEQGRLMVLLQQTGLEQIP
jgi:tetratricopeptide (TPR) repeat protein